MSSLLEQAIIDAKTLKETARKNAEAKILDKYSSKIKQSIEMLLEQDEPAAGGEEAGAAGLDAALGADLGGEVEMSETAKSVVEKVPPAYLGENNMEEVEIDLDSLVEKVNEMKKELKLDVEAESSQAPTEQLPTRIATDTLAEQEKKPQRYKETENKPEEPSPKGGAYTDIQQQDEELEEESLEESFEVDEQLQEEITIDMKNVLPGGINGNQIETEKQMNIALALMTQLEDLKEHLAIKDAEIEALEQHLAESKASEEATKVALTETKNKLNKSLTVTKQLKESFETFSTKINEVNLINARLLYANKVLRNASLNERQKDQIAEAISNASTVEEAKTVYETLQKTMQTVVEKRTAPQSLSEALNKTSSAFLPRKTTPVDSTSDRWKILAGIKK
jgi:myosin heavy subunit